MLHNRAPGTRGPGFCEWPGLGETLSPALEDSVQASCDDQRELAFSLPRHCDLALGYEARSSRLFSRKQLGRATAQEIQIDHTADTKTVVT
jgi:hypothetical protein